MMEEGLVTRVPGTGFDSKRRACAVSRVRLLLHAVYESSGRSPRIRRSSPRRVVRARGEQEHVEDPRLEEVVVEKRALASLDQEVSRGE